MASTNQVVDQITFSEHFKTTPFPAKMEAKIGDQALCRANREVRDVGTKKTRLKSAHTVVPRNNAGDYAQGLEVDIRIFIKKHKVPGALLGS